MISFRGKMACTNFVHGSLLSTKRTSLMSWNQGYVAFIQHQYGLGNVSRHWGNSYRHLKQDANIRCKAEADGSKGDLDNQADNFSGRKSSRNSKSDYSRRQDELQSLASLIPDPMKDESLLDPIDPSLEQGNPKQYGSEALETWDGVDGSATPLGGCALSSLPMGVTDDDDEGSSLGAGGESLPTYRTSSHSPLRLAGASTASNAGGVSSSRYTYASTTSSGGISVRDPESVPPEVQAIEDLLMERAVDEAMVWHHERNEISHSRYATATRFGEILEAVELDDVRRGAIPLLDGTGEKYPSWIRAAEILHEQIPEINAETEAIEIAASEAELQRVKDAILEEVDNAVRLLSDIDPQAGIGRDEIVQDLETSLEELFGDEEDGTLLPGADALNWDFGEGNTEEDLAASTLASMKIEGGQDDIVAVVARKLAPEWDAAAAEGRAEKMKKDLDSSSDEEEQLENRRTKSERNTSVKASVDMVPEESDDEEDIEGQEYTGQEIEDIEEMYTMTDEDDADYHALGLLDGTISDDDGDYQPKQRN